MDDGFIYGIIGVLLGDSTWAFLSAIPLIWVFGFLGYVLLRWLDGIVQGRLPRPPKGSKKWNPLIIPLFPQCSTGFILGGSIFWIP